MVDRLFDFRSTFFQRAQPNPPRVRVRKNFSTDGVVSARAYAYRLTGHFDCSTTTLPIERNGKLCDGVVAPGAVLTSRELTRALEAVAAARERARKPQEPVRDPRTGEWYSVGKAVSRCAFDPHHTLLFYDSSGAVVGGVLVCFSCGEWNMVPAVPAVDGIMSADEERALREIFDAHELGAVLWDDEQEKELSKYVSRVYGRSPDALTEAGKQRETRRRARGSGIDPSKPARDLSRDERLRSCLWFQYERTEGWRSSFECENGRSFRVHQETVEACATRKIDCDASAGELEACKAAVLPDLLGLCADELPIACAKVAACLPELTWLRGP